MGKNKELREISRKLDQVLYYQSPQESIEDSSIIIEDKESDERIVDLMLLILSEPLYSNKVEIRLLGCHLSVRGHFPEENQVPSTGNGSNAYCGESKNSFDLEIHKTYYAIGGDLVNDDNLYAEVRFKCNYIFDKFYPLFEEYVKERKRNTLIKGINEFLVKSKYSRLDSLNKLDLED